MYNLIGFCASVHLPMALFIVLKGLNMVPGEFFVVWRLHKLTVDGILLRLHFYFCGNIQDDHRRDMARLLHQDVAFMVHNSGPLTFRIE